MTTHKEEWKETVKSLVTGHPDKNRAEVVVDFIEKNLAADRARIVEEMKEIIICSAIKMPDGYIIRGHRHDDAIRTASGIPRYKGLKVINDNQGFVTSKGRYVGREEAQIIAGEAKQISSQNYEENTRLYSEDLY